MSTTKAIKGDKKRERERVWEREIETQTDYLEQEQKQNTTSQNSQILKTQAKIEIQTDYPTLKKSIRMRERESETQWERDRVKQR